MTRAVAAFAVLLLAACAAPSKPADVFMLRPVTFAQVPGFDVDMLDGFFDAMDKSCARIAARKGDESFGRFGTYADWQKACDGLSDAADLRARFTPYEVWGDRGTEGLFTGYYAPQLAEAVAGGTPLYARPADLVTVDLGAFREEWKGQNIAGRVDGGRLVPYHTRAEIESGKLGDAATVLARVDDPVDAFFLHIQGSGQVTRTDGSQLYVGYDAQNGHKYHAIGKSLIDRGAIAREDMSMQAIRAWLENNPAEAQALMNENPSYIFFREIGQEGPLGAEGLPLTPHRSLAVDRRKIPYGAPVFVAADAVEAGDAPIRRLMVAQDTGGAIRGAVRGDYFWGAGDVAAHKAGLMKSSGRAWLLLPKDVALPDDLRYRAPRLAYNP